MSALRELPDPADLSEAIDFATAKNDITFRTPKFEPRAVPHRGSDGSSAGRYLGFNGPEPDCPSEEQILMLQKRVAEGRDLSTGKKLPRKYKWRTLCTTCGLSFDGKRKNRLPPHYPKGVSRWSYDSARCTGTEGEHESHWVLKDHGQMLHLINSHLPSVPDFIDISVPRKDVKRMIAKAHHLDALDPCPATKRIQRREKLLKRLEEERVRMHLEPNPDPERVDNFLKTARFRLGETKRQMNERARYAFKTLRWDFDTQPDGTYAWKAWPRWSYSTDPPF